MTTHKEQSFLQAILDEPDAIDLRLIYADWIEDKDPRRAEFIRLQCRIAEMEMDDVDRVELEARQTALLSLGRPQWDPDFAQSQNCAIYRYGFLEAFQTTLTTFLTHATQWLAQAPLREMRFWGSTDHFLADLAHEPRLEKLRRLDLQMAPDEHDLRQLAESPFNDNLRSLKIDHFPTRAENPDSALAPIRLPQLTGLSIKPAQFQGGEDSVAIQPTDVAHCTRLTLSGRIVPPFIEGLPTAATIPQLDYLRLALANLDLERVEALNGSPLLESLSHLTLEHTFSSTAELLRLLEDAPMPLLRRLNLKGNRMGSTEARALTRSRFYRNLTSLYLRWASLNDESLLVLTHGQKETQLRTLDLSNNQITERGAIALAQSPLLEGVGRLLLWDNQLGDQGAKAIAHSPHSRNLRALNLGRNGIGKEGFEAIAESPHLSRLVTLDLRRNHVGPEGGKAFAKSTKLPNLRVLILHQNRLGDQGASALADSKNLTGLYVLGLNENQIREGTARKLTTSPNFPNMARLLLADNGTGTGSLREPWY